MRLALSMILFLTFALGLRADSFVYVSMAPEQKIQLYRLGADDGKLTAVDTIRVDGIPGVLAVDSLKKTLFASLRAI